MYRLSAAIIMEIVYGHRISKADDEYFKLTEDFVRILRVASKPSLLDISPYCKRKLLHRRHIAWLTLFK